MGKDDQVFSTIHIRFEIFLGHLSAAIQKAIGYICFEFRIEVRPKDIIVTSMQMVFKTLRPGGIPLGQVQGKKI